MKKQAIIISVLIAVVLIAMFFPWGYMGRWANGPGETPQHYYQFESYIGALFTGSLYLGISFLLALAAFVFSFFSGKKRICRILCGLLLLGSAGLCLYQGIEDGFDRFTALTWGIFGALVLLGLWTLFFIKTERNARPNNYSKRT